MTGMPKYVVDLFWENDDFDGSKNATYVISRILEMGDDKQVSWMLSYYEADKIKAVLKKSKNISQKSANYWSNYFDIDYKEIECLKMQLPNRQNRFY